MIKTKLILIASLMLVGCGTTNLVPEPYMPDAPEILMKAPLELQTIKNGEENAKKNN